jgi:hypothetical protein
LRLNTLLTATGIYFARPRLASCAYAAIIGAGLILAPAAANAQSAAEEAYRAYVGWLESLGTEITSDPVRYDAATDTLTVPNNKMTLAYSMTVPARYLPEEFRGPGDDKGNGAESKNLEITYKWELASGEMTFQGLSSNGTAFSGTSWQYSDDARLDISMAFDSVFKFDFDFGTDMKGVVNRDFSIVMAQLPAEDPNRPASRWLPFARKLLMSSYGLSGSEEMNFEWRGTGTYADGETIEFASGRGTLTGIRMVDIGDGRMASYEVDLQEMEQKTRSAEDNEMRTETGSQGKTVSSGVNMMALVDLLDPAVPETGDPITAIDRHTVESVQRSSELAKGLAVDIKIGPSVMNRFAVVKREFDFLGLLDQIISGKEPDKDLVAMAVFQLLRSFSIADGKMEGLELTMPIPANPGETLRATLAEYSASGMSADGIDDIRLAGLDVPALPGGGHVRLGSASVGGIKFADFQPMAAMLPALLAEGEAGKPDPMAITRAFLPRSISIALKDFDLNIPGETQVSIASSEHTVSTVAAPLPTSVYSKTDKAVLPLEALDNEQATAFLRSLGFENITWSNETRLHWDENTLDLTLEKLMIDIEGFGTAEATMRFGNVPKALFEDPKNQGQMALVSASFIGAEISFVDAGGTNKTIAQMASQSGISETDFIKVLVAQTEAGLVALNNPEFANSVTDAVAEFLTNPGKLRITLEPQNPVPVAQIVGSVVTPQVLPDLLSAQIKASN